MTYNVFGGTLSLTQSIISQTWSHPVTRQRWRSHHSISHDRKTPCCMQTSRLYLLQNWSYCVSNFYVAEMGIFASCDLDLEPTLFIYELDLYSSLRIYTCSKNELSISKLSKDIVLQML